MQGCRFESAPKSKEYVYLLTFTFLLGSAAGEPWFYRGDVVLQFEVELID